MIFRICLIILLVSSSNGVWNPIYKEKVQPEVVKKPPLYEPPPPEHPSMYYSAFIGSVFGVLITSGFFYCTTKYYKKNDKGSRGDHEQLTVNFPEDPQKEAPHPTDHVSEATSIHLITNKELVSPEDILVDPPLDSDPTEDNSQQTPVTDSSLEETLPASLPTAKETDCKTRSLSNSPRDTLRPKKSNDAENKRARSLSSARRQAKKEAFPSSPVQSDATVSDNCSCKSKLALETLEKELEDLRKSMNNAERMKRESMRALSSLKKEMLAMGSSIKEMGKEKDKQRELIETLKKEKKECVRVANARWRQKLVQLQETMKMRSELSKSELSSGSRESASGNLNSSPVKTDFTPGRGGLARDKSRSSSEMRSRDSRINFRSSKIDSKSSSPMPTMILPVFFEDPVGKDENECDARCENRQVNESREESESDNIKGGRNFNEDVRKDDRKEKCQDGSRDDISKGNDDNKIPNSHTTVPNGVKDIKQDTVPSITDNKVHITTDREVAMITEMTKMQDSDSKAEGSEVKFKGETSELEVVENRENHEGKAEISPGDKSEAELSVDFDFDFGEDEIVRNDSTELDYSRVLSSQTFCVSKTEMSRKENEQANDEMNEEEIDAMNTSEDRGKNIPELTKADETDAASKLENVKLNAEDSDDKLKQPSSSAKERDESPEVNQDNCVADLLDSVKKGAIPRPIAQQKLQRTMFSKSYSVCKDNQKDTEDYVKSSTSAVIPARKSATAVATALLRNKPPKPNVPSNKQRRTRNDSSLVKSLLTRPSTSGCAIGDKVGSSFVTVTKNVCVLKTCGPDDQPSNNADKTNELKDGIKSSLDSNRGITTEGETVEQNVVDGENRKPLTEIFQSENLFWVKFDEGRKNNTPSSDKEKKATKTENKPDPTHLEEKETAKQGYTEESFDGDSILIPDTMEKIASEPKTKEVTDDLKKCKNFTTEAERCIQNIVSLGPSFTEEDKATLEFLLDRLNPVDDYRQLASFNDTLESVVTSNNERNPSLNLPEKSNSEHVNVAQKSERPPIAMRSVSECANGKKEGSELTKGLAEKLSHYFVYDPERLAESFLTQAEDQSSEE